MSGVRWCASLARRGGCVLLRGGGINDDPGGIRARSTPRSVTLALSGLNQRPAVGRFALAAIAAFTILVVWVAVFAHPVPLYSTETDLVGDYIPAARALQSGQLTVASYASKGLGYTLLLAIASPLLGGDAFLAAKLINCVAAALAAWACFALFSRTLGPFSGFLVLIGLLANPTFLACTLEAGTDMPAMALGLVATYLIMWRTSARSGALAGLLAGYAVITRYNYIFLPVVGLALLGVSRDRRRSLAYLAASALPISAWLFLNLHLTGNPFTNSNYLNLAYALYGNGDDWEHFVTQVGPRFHSIADVLRLDPLHAAIRLGSNIAVYWWQDLLALLPLGIGLVAPLGLIWHSPKDRSALWTAMHFVLAYLVLCLVFRAPRFALYLIPFYLGGIVAFLFGAAARPRTVDRAAGQVDWLGIARAALLLILFGASGVQAAGAVRTALAHSPDETRLAGLMLRTLGPPDAIVMARKPHVAYFAGMRFVPMPAANSIGELIAACRSTGTTFVFISPIEVRLRPAYAVLADSGLDLPALRQVAHDSAGPGKAFSLYTFRDPRTSLGLLQSALAETLVHHAATHPSAESEIAAATELLGARRYRDALEHLAVAERLWPADPDIAALQSNAHHALGEYEEAALACERSMRLGSASGMHYGQLGRIRYMQRRYAEARNNFKRALALDPGRLDDVFLLGLSLSRLGEYSAAAQMFERFLSLEPTSAQAVRLAAGNRILAGQPTRALSVIEAARRRGVVVGEDLRAMADSLGGTAVK